MILESSKENNEDVIDTLKDALQGMELFQEFLTLSKPEWLIWNAIIAEMCAVLDTRVLFV
jgi:hypothetical protein